MECAYINPILTKKFYLYTTFHKDKTNPNPSPSQMHSITSHVLKDLHVTESQKCGPDYYTGRSAPISSKDKLE